MSNLKEHIIASYGAGVYNETLKLKETKKAMAKNKNQFIFLQRCVKHRIIPKSLRIKCPVRNKRSNRIVDRFRFELLLSTKNDAKHRFFRFTKMVKDIENKLIEILSNEDMTLIRNVTEKSRELMFVRSKERLVKKFNTLKDLNVIKHGNINKVNTLVKEAVLNLVDDVIPENHKDVLNLGPKFVPHIKNIPYMDIVSITESSALKLEYSNKVCEAQILRKDVLKILKMAKPIKDNLTRNQRTAIREIKEDNEINIYPYDKGAGMVRIKKEDGIQKIREQIGDTEVIDNDPTDNFARDIRKELSILKRKGRFTDKVYESLYPSDAIAPRMYGTVKAHKPEKGYPMRIVVSTIGTPPYGISAYLVNFIQQTLNKNKTRLKNSVSFVNEAKNWNIGIDEIQVSYDVVNLYPSVPLKEATSVMIDILNNDFDSIKQDTKLEISEIKMLIELCLSVCYFIWNNEIHLLKDAGPIGLSLMVVMAEAFLQVLEAKAIDDALFYQPPIKPLTYIRYVDDSHSRFENLELAEKFLSLLNNQHPRIQYTIEKENGNKELQFLDINVINNGTGKYEFDIYRKKAITNVQVKPESGHDPSILRGIFKGFVHRAVSICSEKYLDKEIDFLVNIFIENGYDKNELLKMVNQVKLKRNMDPVINDVNSINATEIHQTITLPWIPGGVSTKLKKIYRNAGYKVVFKAGPNIQTILTSKNKMKLPKNSFPGVYKTPCSCGITPYRGETKKRILTRNYEHQKYIEKEQWKKSGVAVHARTCEGNIEFQNTETVKVIYNRFDRKVRETLEIQRHDCHITKGGMNPDKGQYVTTNFWMPFFRHLNQRENANNEG